MSPRVAGQFFQTVVGHAPMSTSAVSNIWPGAVSCRSASPATSSSAGSHPAAGHRSGSCDEQLLPGAQPFPHLRPASTGGSRAGRRRRSGAAPSSPRPRPGTDGPPGHQIVGRATQVAPQGVGPFHVVDDRRPAERRRPPAPADEAAGHRVLAVLARLQLEPVLQAAGQLEAVARGPGRSSPKRRPAGGRQVRAARPGAPGTRRPAAGRSDDGRTRSVSCRGTWGGWVTGTRLDVAAAGGRRRRRDRHGATRTRSNPPGRPRTPR